ncbi:S1 family peptidase [Reyranella sp.]|uniref:S1 family peptidase n=1 Tax=Reyranella sp. TaxID=1929291 RepID=UPI003F71A222
MNIIDEIIHTTVRIETVAAGGQEGSGTGFFVSLPGVDEHHSFELLITNKHAIENVITGKVNFSTRENGEVDAPLLGKHVPVHVANFQNNWIHHPDPAVDLAALPIGGLLQLLDQQNIVPFYKAISLDHIATEQQMKDLLAIEQVTMVGYPNGLWDSTNNLPIVRRGITATSPAVNFQGRPEFLIDCAIFPGSSGSPVFLLDMGAFTSRQGMHLGQSRIKLIGVLHSVHCYSESGEIVSEPTPTAKQVLVTRQFMNLGICANASLIYWFAQAVRERLAREQMILAGQAST